MLVLNTAIAVFLINRMMEDVRQLSEIRQPLEAAVLEMEINADETAQALLNFVRVKIRDMIHKL